MFNLSVDDSGKNGTLTLAGDLVIQNAHALRSSLDEALTKVEETLTITFEEVSRADLSGLQLLCAAHKSFLNSDKKITLEGALPDALKEVIGTAGFSNCAGDGDSSGIWTGVKANG
ncbi:MAG: STAS domain-containing protein [Magnetococcales bacterium]|nr:STAS domain-containing protein [Magnetococcales bacterium]